MPKKIYVGGVRGYGWDPYGPLPPYPLTKGHPLPYGPMPTMRRSLLTLIGLLRRSYGAYSLSQGVLVRHIGGSKVAQGVFGPLV